MNLKFLGVLPEKKEIPEDRIMGKSFALGFNCAIDFIGEIEVELDREKLTEILYDNGVRSPLQDLDYANEEGKARIRKRNDKRIADIVKAIASNLDKLLKVKK